MKMPPRVGQEVSRSVEQAQGKTKILNKLPPVQTLAEGETIIYNKNTYIRENGSLRRYKSTDSYETVVSDVASNAVPDDVRDSLIELITALKTEGVIK